MKKKMTTARKTQPTGYIAGIAEEEIKIGHLVSFDAKTGGLRRAIRNDVIR